MAIPPAFIQDLITRADVVEVVGRHVQLRKAGANFLGLCPFHDEKSPSFTVSPSKQFYHCFGCGKNGNSIGFLMDHAGMGFVDAVKDLAQRYGLQVPDDGLSPEDRVRSAQRSEQQATLTEMLERASRSYRRQLRDNPRAVDYLKGRGLSGEVALRYGLGYAPEGWRHLASVCPDYTAATLEQAGLVIHAADEDKRYDRFRDRIMFPIRNVKGECIGFGGRVLGEGTPKYLNSPETPVFSKGQELYGLWEARQAIRERGFALVTEGYMDVVALAQLGFPNAVATLGTACTPDHVRKLFRFTDSVVFSFDGDAAGRRAARKALDGALPYATDLRQIRFLFLPTEHDPDSFIRERGAPAFSEQIDQAVPLSQFLLDAAAEDCALNTAEGRARMASQTRGLWTALPDGALRRQLLAELADRCQLGAHELLDLWGVVTPGGGTTPIRSPSPSGHTRRSSSSSLGSGVRGSAFTSARRPGRTAPSSRADHLVRLLLSDAAAWEALSHEDHAMLCALPPPHGVLLRWLDLQVHEHGAQPWGALREGLREHEAEALALRVMQAALDAPAQDTASELRDSLYREWIEHIKGEEMQLVQTISADPADAVARAHYRTLQQRRKDLELQLRT